MSEVVAIPEDFDPYAVKPNPTGDLLSTFDAVGREFKDGVQISGPPPGPYRYSPWQPSQYPLWVLRGKHPNSGRGKHKGWQRDRRSAAMQEALQSCAFEKREYQKKKRLAADITQEFAPYKYNGKTIGWASEIPQSLKEKMMAFIEKYEQTV